MLKNWKDGKGGGLKRASGVYCIWSVKQWRLLFSSYLKNVDGTSVLLDSFLRISVLPRTSISFGFLSKGTYKVRLDNLVMV